MSEANQPGVIVVAPEAVHAALAASGVPWNVQPRQGSVAQMWDGLSGGQLDTTSRVLVFSDSLLADQPGDDGELTQTARAIVAMANAGAVVALTSARPAATQRIREEIDNTCRQQGLDPNSISILVVGANPPSEVVKAVVGAAAPYLPEELPESPVEESLVAPAPAPERDSASIVSGPVGIPDLPPLGGSVVEPAHAPSPARVHDDYPDQADRELLSRPKLPGQTTITVTSSKGGSGKSTASVLLAATIARASREAGKPLSVCLIDLDTRDGQIASLIGTFMPTALNIRVQPSWDEERIRRNLVHAEALDIDTLLAPIRPRTADTVGPEFYRTIVESLQRMFDVVIMDTSVQYLEPLISKVALVEPDEILFVTNLAATAVQGMARALREITAPLEESGLGVPREKIGIIVNQSVANVGMEQDQVLAAGLGVPVVGVIPLATRDVLTATNLNSMESLLDHPLLAPAYLHLARACLPHRELQGWPIDAPGEEAAEQHEAAADLDQSQRRRGLFRR